MAKNKKVSLEKPSELRVTEEQQKTIDRLLESSKREVTNFWDQKDTKEIYIPVEGGEIRALHVKPENPKNKQLLVHIPGWGVTPNAFNVLYEALHEEYEFYFIETREKSSSRIKRRKANLTIQQKAIDIQTALNFLELTKKDYVLFAPCWAATIVIEGLKRDILTTPTIVMFDPMHKLWFSKFLLNISPLFPAFIVSLIKPILMFFVFLGMKEKTQLERNKNLVKNAVVWKWKQAAYKAKDLELFGTLDVIDKELLIFNGTTDKVHKQTDYPKLAAELPRGRFFYINTDESNRERLQAVVMLEFAKVTGTTAIPEILKQFEKKLMRGA